MQILVYGATGYTGTLICRALLAAGAPPVLSGRDRARLEALAKGLGGGLSVRPAQVHDAGSLARALRGVGVVVNCAGPFARLGEPVVDAAIAAGAHYVDITGEQPFMRDIYERKESAARRAEVAVVNGMAFEIALGDWAARIAADALPAPVAAAAAGAAADAGDAAAAGDAEAAAPAEPPPIDEVVVAYGLHRFRPTRGTRLAALDVLGRTGYIWHHDRWDPARPGAEVRRFEFGDGARDAMSFPSGEIISVPRHVATRRVQTYVSLSDGRWVTRATAALSPAVPLLARSPLFSWARAQVEALPAAPSAEDRRFSEFSIVAEARRGRDQTRVSVRGRDPYGLTGELAAWAALALAGRPARRGPVGVLAPSEAFEAAASLDEIARRWDLRIDRS